MQYPVGSKLKLRFLGILLATSMAALCCTNAVAQSQNASRTNFVIILSDDMGISDLGCYGGEIQTVNKLARVGQQRAVL